MWRKNFRTWQMWRNMKFSTSIICLMWSHLKYLPSLPFFSWFWFAISFVKINNVYNWWGFIAIYAVLLLNLLFTLFCREIYFATIYALSCGEKLSPKVHMWRKNDKYQVWAQWYNVHILSWDYTINASKVLFHTNFMLPIGFQNIPSLQHNCLNMALTPLPRLNVLKKYGTFGSRWLPLCSGEIKKIQ